MLFHSRMTITALAALRLVKHFDSDEIGSFVPCNDHLGYALAIVDDEILVAKVNQQHSHLASVIGIDGAWGIEHGKSMLQRQSAARAHLCLIACWQGDMKSCRDETALHWVQCYRLVDVSAQVHSRALESGISRKRLMTFINYFYLYHVSICNNNVQKYEIKIV